jgi:hypothetical protein
MIKLNERNARREIRWLRRGLARLRKERDSFILQMLEWRWTCMELTHGHHFMARRLSVVDGPNGMCNALAYHMPQKTRNKIGDLIARCHEEQFRYVNRAQEDIMEFQMQVTTLRS